MPKQDSLVKAMARKLVAYDSNIERRPAANVQKMRGPGRKSRRVGIVRRAGPIGKRGEQYLLLKDLYQLIAQDDRFSRLAEETHSKKHKRQLRQLVVLVRRAFISAYGDDSRSYRQRATTWSAVLHQAWDNRVTVSGFRLFVLDHGGIQSLYQEWKENRSQSKT